MKFPLAKTMYPVPTYCNDPDHMDYERSIEEAASINQREDTLRRVIADFREMAANLIEKGEPGIILLRLANQYEEEWNDAKME